MTTCTTPDCNKITSLFLCTACIVELDELLQDCSPLVRFLDGPISGTSVTSGPGAGGGGHPGSKPPGSLDAMLLKAWLCQLPYRAYSEAVDNPTAGQTLFMARLWVNQARDLVWGPEDKRVYGECEEPLVGSDDPQLCNGKLTARPDDVSVKCQECGTVHHIHDIMYRIKEKVRGQPMPPRAVREHLQKKAKAFIPKKDFENWVMMGRLSYVLDRVTTEGRPQRIYYPGDVLAVFQYMRDRRRIRA